MCRKKHARPRVANDLLSPGARAAFSNADCVLGLLPGLPGAAASKPDDLVVVIAENLVSRRRILVRQCRTDPRRSGLALGYEQRRSRTRVCTTGRRFGIGWNSAACVAVSQPPQPARRVQDDQ